MAGKWWYVPQKEVNEQLQGYDRYSCLDQCITNKVVFEKFLVVEEGQPKVILFEYVKVDYGVGYKINKFNAI